MQGPKKTDVLIIFQKCLLLWVICLVKLQNNIAFEYNCLFDTLLCMNLVYSWIRCPDWAQMNCDAIFSKWDKNKKVTLRTYEFIFSEADLLQDGYLPYQGRSTVCAGCSVVTEYSWACTCESFHGPICICDSSSGRCRCCCVTGSKS